MKLLKLIVTAVFLLGCLSRPVLAQALELIYPEDGTWVPYSHLMIVRAPDISGISIEMNATPGEIFDMDAYRAEAGDFIKMQPDFAPGKNTLVLRGYDKTGKQISEVKSEIFYQDDPYGRTPAGYRPNIMHTPQREALCSPCHNMAPTAAQLNESSAEKNPCGACHRRMLAKKFVHGPAGVFECVYCHDPGSKPAKYRSRGGDAAICTECHQDKFDDFNKNAYVHGPVAVGICSVCHDPHASDNAGQMLRPVNVLCVGCHAKVDLTTHVVRGVGKPHPLKGVPDPLAPGRQLSCASCHNPHGGANWVFFSADVAGSPMLLCQKCHKK